MDIISSIIDLYFSVMDSVNVRNVSIAIIVIIIGIEFIEFFIDPEEAEKVRETNYRAKKKNRFIKQLFGLDKKRVEAPHRNRLDESDRASILNVNSKGASVSGQTSAMPEDSAMLHVGDDGVEVIGSKTFTIRTILDGNHIYMEKVETATR